MHYEPPRSRVPAHSIGITGTLTIVFITLKLLGIIDWSWWLVLSPVWISALVTVGFLAMAMIVGFFMRKDKYYDE